MRGDMARRFASLMVATLLVAACGGTGPAKATSPAGTFTTGTEAPAISPTGTAALPTPAPATEAPPTQAPATEAPATEAPASPAPSAGGSPGPSASIGQYLESITIRHTASCTSDNGTGTVGDIRISWVAVGTTGVRISIDPPSPDVAYGYGFADYLELSGHADVPYACGPSLHDSKGNYHLYVVTTLHGKYDHYFYRYAKVYDTTP